MTEIEKLKNLDAKIKAWKGTKQGLAKLKKQKDDLEQQIEEVEAAKEAAEAEKKRLEEQSEAKQMPAYDFLKEHLIVASPGASQEQKKESKETEELKSEIQRLEAELDKAKESKTASIEAVLAKAAKMEKAAKDLKKIEEVGKRLERFEIEKDAYTAEFQIKDSEGNIFATSNTYLVDSVLKALKAETQSKRQELESELKELF